MKNKFIFIIFIAIIVIIYRNWFFSANIIGGDWPYLFQEAINTFSILPPSWSPTHGNGLGGTYLVYALDSYMFFTGWLFSKILYIPWNIVYKVFWFYLFLVLSVLSIKSLFKNFLPSIGFIYKVLGIFIYVTNTYVLMMVSGGQMGIALAYSISPLVFVAFVKVINNVQNLENSTNIFKSLNSSIIAGLLYAILVMFDFRVAYMVLIIIIIYLGLNVGGVLKNNKKYLFYSINNIIIIPLGLTGLLHSFWLFPVLFVHFNPFEKLGSAYTSVESLRFFSFASFSNTLGLLHPNWPDNIFGKVSFMKPEFLLLPVIAFSSLFFVFNKSKIKQLSYLRQQKNIIFFCLVALIGVFLAKGANEPFGGFYVWMFKHIPGFIMFRDPTKFYLFIALSYSFLIPFSLYKILGYFNNKNKLLNTQITNIILFLSIIYLLFLIRPAFLGEVKGTFIKREVPIEYSNLKNQLKNDSGFYRTLWLPRQSRFTYADDIHPAMEASPLFSATNEAQLIAAFNVKNTKNYLADLAVKYVVLPYDPYGEIFIEDRKYSAKKRKYLEDELDKISWLKKINNNKITIYQIQEYNDLFFIKGSDRLSYQVKNPTHYVINVNIKQPRTLIFSQNYNPYWQAQIENKAYQSKQTPVGLNSFSLNKTGNYKIDIYYSAEKYYIIGGVISVITIIIILILLFKLKRKNYAK